MRCTFEVAAYEVAAPLWLERAIASRATLGVVGCGEPVRAEAADPQLFVRAKEERVERLRSTANRADVDFGADLRRGTAVALRLRHLG
jgi:hypothetical protein